MRRSAGIAPRLALAAMLLAALVLALPGAARAQRSCAPPAGASDDAAAQDEAFALYAQSRERYAAGEFEAAVELLERAYARHPEPVLLYNLARTLEGMARWGEAADAYACYLERAPDARDRGAILQRVETLRRSDAASRLPALPEDREPERAAPQPASAAPGAPAAQELHPGPFVVLGLGAAAIAGGAIVGGVALAMRDEAQADPVHASAAQRERTARDYAIAADVAWSAAGAMLVAGLVWGLVDWTSGGGDEAVQVSLGPTSVTVSGTF